MGAQAVNSLTALLPGSKAVRNRYENTREHMKAQRKNTQHNKHEKEAITNNNNQPTNQTNKQTNWESGKQKTTDTHKNNKIMF